MPVAYPNRNPRDKKPVSPDRGEVQPDPWQEAKQRYVQPFFDMMDVFKGGYDNLINALSGNVARPKRK